MASPKAMASTARERVPLLDHLIRAAQRYQADGGDRLAAGVTYYWFLSLFPILLLVISVLGYALGDSAEQRVVDGLGDSLPNGLAETLGTTLQEAKGPAGIIGVIGLLFAGLGWVDALREALRTMWHQNILVGNIVIKKLRDIGSLLGLFAVIAGSVFVTGFVTGFSDQVLDVLNVDSTPAATAFTRLAGYSLALAADTALFLYLFRRMSRIKAPIRGLLGGALFGAVGFELLKVIGGIYVARTTSKGEATYGTFAVVVGVLLFLFLLSRLILFAAAFTVTGKGVSDRSPSGTADPGAAIAAGIPVDFVTTDQEDPATLRGQGAPSPLRQAVRGKMTDSGRSSNGDRESAGPATTAVTVPEPRGADVPKVPADQPTADQPTADQPAADQSTPEAAGEPARSWSARPRRRVPAATAAAQDGASPDEAPADPRTAAAPAAVASPPLPAPDEKAPRGATYLPSSQADLDRLREMFPVPRAPQTDQEKKVVLVARATAVAGGALLAGTSVYVGRTLSRIVRR